MEKRLRKRWIRLHKRGYGKMSIIIRLDRVMADRKISVNDLAKELDMTNVNLSNLKTGKMKGIRFETMERICKALDCQPGDLIAFSREEATK